MRILTLLALSVGTQVAAQDVVFSPETTEACLSAKEKGDNMRDCVGQSAIECMNVSPDGSTDPGILTCLSAEFDYWDGRLNVAYKEVIGSAQAADQDGTLGTTQEASLREMQRAWIGFRDATCDFEFNYVGGGVAGNAARTHCQMRMTGEQTLYLLSNPTSW